MIDLPTLLVACEESQRVCSAFRERGWVAFSCDLLECSGGHPEWHIQGDCLDILDGGWFMTCDGYGHVVDKWDLIIAHPPCTFLTNSGNAYFDTGKYKEKAWKRMTERNKAISFFYKFVLCNAKRIAIENPIGVMSSAYRPPDQIIQPFQFGHPYTKSTCLWLFNLPPLIPTVVLTKPSDGWENQQITKDGRYGGFGGKWGCRKDGKWLRYSDEEVKKERSRTFPGIAKAMASQWGSFVESDLQVTD